MKTENVDFSWSDLANNYKCPDRMDTFEFRTMTELVDKPIIIKDYELFVSENSTKYKDGNEQGVHIAIYDVESKTTYRTTTHGKVIVRAFVKLNDMGLKMPEDLVTMFIEVTTKNGYKTYAFSN